MLQRGGTGWSRLRATWALVAAAAALLSTSGCGSGGAQPSASPPPTYVYATAQPNVTVGTSPTTAPAASAAYRYVGMQKYTDPQGDWVTVKYYAGPLARGSAAPAAVSACSDQQIVRELVALTGFVTIQWDVVQPPMVFSFDPATTMQPVFPSQSKGVFDTALETNGNWTCSNATYPDQPGIGEPLRGTGTITATFVSFANIIGPANPALTEVERTAWSLDPTLSASTGEQLALVQPAFSGPDAALCPSLAAEDVGPWRLSFFLAPPYELAVPAHDGRPAYTARCNPAPSTSP